MQSRTRWIPWSAAFVCVLGTLALPVVILHQFGRFAPTDDPTWGGDHLYYFTMSQFPIGASAHVPIENATLPYAPFSWRILTPFLASLLPIDKHWAFLAITVAALILTSFVFYVFLRRRQFSHSLGLLGVGFFLTLYPAAGFLVLDNFLPDPLGFLTIAVGLLAVEMEWDSLFLVVTCVGVLNKEVALFLLPAFLIFLARRKVRPAAWRVLLIVAAPIAIWLVVRLAIIPTNSYSYLDELSRELRDRFTIDSLRHQFAMYTFSTWGPLLFVLLTPLRRTLSTLVKEPHLAYWLGVSYLQTLFATDTQRLLVFAFPVVILLALDDIVHMSQLLSTPAVVLGTAILVGQIVYFFPYVLGSSVYLVLIWIALLALWFVRSKTSTPTPA